jgi:hypothetical protein
MLLVFHGIGPALGLAVLFWAANGPDHFVRIYVQLVTKAQVLPYAIATGDGPWHRYLIDLISVSPLVMLLAIGGAFVAIRTRGPALYLLAFVAITYIPMVNVRYAMNLRYANMWDMPLRFLACTLLASLVPALGPRGRIVADLVLVLAMFVEFRQYTVLFVEHSLYELVPKDILSAQDILKPMQANPPQKP